LDGTWTSSYGTHIQYTHTDPVRRPSENFRSTEHHGSHGRWLLARLRIGMLTVTRTGHKLESHSLAPETSSDQTH
jgi:hypothetical protein